jgi:ABC-type transport system substrate-binding protein
MCVRPRFAGLGTAAVAALLVLGSCSSSDDDPELVTPTSGTSGGAAVLRLGIASPFELDPADAVPTEQGQMIGIDLLFDGLTAADPETREAIPSLASWAANDSFTEWTFTLRDGASFHDGTEITGEDVKFSLERVAGLGTTSLAGVRLEVIKGYEEFVAGETETIGGITVVDEGRAVHISTSGAYAPLPELLSSPIFGIVPAALVAADEADDSATGSEFFEAPVGSGPLRLAGDEADSSAAAERPDGSDDVRVLLPAAEDGAAVQVDEVRLVHFDDVAASYQAFRDGALDWSQVPSDQAVAATDEFGDQAVAPFHAEFFFGINTADEAYGARDFRAAIVRSIDRAALVEEFYPTGRLLNGTVVDGVSGYQEDPCGEVCAYDPEAAEALVEEEFGGDEPPTVQLDFYEGSRERDVAAAIQADLAEVGIEAELRPHPAAEYETFVTSGDQGIFLFGWVGIAPTADSYLAPLFLSGSPDNVTSFGSEVIDATIAAARQFPTAEERATAYQAVEETIMGRVPVIPLVQVDTLAVTSARVQGWQPQLDGTFVVGSVTLDG